jgi:glyoxylase-like metal-dependent hydrolase (beta-lactamase superfamily II)
MEATIARELEPAGDLDRLVQFDRIGKGALGYLLLSDGEAFVIDAPRRTVRYLEAIDAAGATLVGVADTHAHADYISGSPALAVLNDAPYHLHPADAIYPYDGTPGVVRHADVEDGQTIRFGRAELTVVHTPGHTEGSVSYLLGDAIAFTGDFLFIASVGRPDLGGKTEAWTPVLWRTIARARKEWPKSIRVQPAHYAHASERNADRSVGRALGEIEKANVPFTMPDEKSFTRWIVERAGAFPEAYKRIKAINLGLETVDDAEATELEAGKNQCALG